MSTTLQIMSISCAIAAFAVSLSQLLNALLVRDKAKRVLTDLKIVDAKMRVSLRSDDIVKAERALRDLREIIRSDKKVGDSFTSREKKTLRKILSSRAGARFLAY